MDVISDISLSEAGTTLTVDLEAIVANWQTLRMVCGDAECGAVVKADAYGLALKPGERVGEDQSWVARGPHRICTISTGFADGVPQGLTRTKSGAGGFVVSQGKKCPYIGGVGMDLVAVDTSDSGYVERGDMVELIGKTITIDDFATAAGMTGYEALTRLGPRCHRRYQKL
jgi:alanine racemase